METKYKGYTIDTHQHTIKNYYGKTHLTDSFDYVIYDRKGTVRTGWDMKTEQEALDKAIAYIDQHSTPKRVKRFLK